MYDTKYDTFFAIVKKGSEPSTIKHRQTKRQTLSILCSKPADFLWKNFHKVFNINLLDLPILLVSLKTEKPIGSAFLFFKRGGDPNVAEAVLTDEKINLIEGMCNVLRVVRYKKRGVLRWRKKNRPKRAAQFRPWVKNTIDGKEYELDISFKKYKQVESISDEIEKQNIDVDISDFKDSSDFYLYLSKFDDQSSEEISVNVTGKMIVQKNISKIPLKLPYICGTIKEQVKNIYDSKIVDTDLLKIGINNGYQQVISGPKAYYNVP